MLSAGFARAPAIARSAALVLAAALGLAMGAAGAADASLPRAPFDLAARPATVAEGGTLVLRLAPTAVDGRDGPTPPVDLYVAVNRHRELTWAYLSPDERWSSAPRPYRANMSAGRVAPLDVVLRGVNPPGWYTFRIQLVRPGESPSRKHYSHRSVETVVRVEPAPPPSNDTLPLILLGLFTLFAWGLAIALPAGRPDEPRR